ncbi:hypothetical protein KM043_009838 [Ampulex compressa]|nr:hypothetical protein KM043_009838 [Ampulex compressa]
MEMHKSAQYERYCKQMISVGDEATSAEKSYSYNVSTYLLDENKEKDVAPPSYPCATSEKDEETRNVVRQCIRPVQYYVQGCAKPLEIHQVATVDPSVFTERRLSRGYEDGGRYCALGSRQVPFPRTATISRDVSPPAGILFLSFLLAVTPREDQLAASFELQHRVPPRSGIYPSSDTTLPFTRWTILGPPRTTSMRATACHSGSTIANLSSNPRTNVSLEYRETHSATDLSSEGRTTGGREPTFYPRTSGHSIQRVNPASSREQLPLPSILPKTGLRQSSHPSSSGSSWSRGSRTREGGARGRPTNVRSSPWRNRLGYKWWVHGEEGGQEVQGAAKIY